jgi:uncharacterized protein (DUF952 family)
MSYNMKDVPSRYAKDGFIHASTADQVEGVKGYLPKGNYTKLTLQVNKLHPKIVFEKAGDGKSYPHIFGAINPEAVINEDSVVLAYIVYGLGLYWKLKCLH